MKWKINVSPLPCYLLVTVSGKFNIRENRRMWDEIFALPRWKRGTAVLIDQGGLLPFGPEGELYMRDAAGYLIDKHGKLGESFIATCNTPHEFYRYGRELQHELRINHSTIRIQQFADKESAIRWLEHLAEMTGGPVKQVGHRAGSAA